MYSNSWKLFTCIDKNPYDFVKMFVKKKYAIFFKKKKQQQKTQTKKTLTNNKYRIKYWCPSKLATRKTFSS